MFSFAYSFPFFSLFCRFIQVVVKGNFEDDNSDAVSVYDFRGNPADKRRTGGWLGAGLILGLFFFFNLAIYPSADGFLMSVFTFLFIDYLIAVNRD